MQTVLPLRDLVDSNFRNRKEAAASMGISEFTLNNMICRGMKAMKLENGDYITVTKFNKFISC